MTLSVRVEGGTGAGRRRPLESPHREPWECRCPHGRPLGTAPAGEFRLHKLNPPFLVRCSGCGTRRP